MDVENAYNSWAPQYDTNQNKTRDLEGIVLRDRLKTISFKTVLEIGCGTGKNTQWLVEKAQSITSVDFSDEMLERAKLKVPPGSVTFIKADISNEWDFDNPMFDLVCFSLVLEHIKNLDFIFQQTIKCLKPEGCVYVGELHPFKQYTGTKAKFTTDEGTNTVPCFNHHISEFIHAAKKHGLTLESVEEYFDEDNHEIPRILALIFIKKNVDF